MKRELLLVFLGVSLLTGWLTGQDCSIISKANDITPDRLCSPVSVEWEVSVRGVNDAGTPVKIRYRWDDGSTETFDAININPDPSVREWAYTASHTYTSKDDKCNYHPEATLIVNGQACTSSTQEQIVTVWDNDDSNGGHLHINPSVYPICFGNGDNVRFRDNTQFNCVPPQENDVPNTDTRWIQWIYGTQNTMTGIPVTINGNPHVFPYTDNVITLPGPVTGSGKLSDVINVAADKLVGQFFEVTLRYWNYCNPYDDPLIPGPPADPVNGDNEPMTETAKILIVPYPDAEIDPVDPVCDDGDSLFLTAADPGGQWSGSGIVDPAAGIFVPSEAGEGDHIIAYEITDGNGCSDRDTAVIHVMPGPEANITPVDPVCNYFAPFNLESAAPAGTWSGNGITDASAGTFSPETADTGLHVITFTSVPDINGCKSSDQVSVKVYGAPDAWFLTEDSAWCEGDPGNNTAMIEICGTNDMDYELIWQLNGKADTIFNISTDTLEAYLPGLPGMNTYRLTEVAENFGDLGCKRSIDDVLHLKLYPKPQMKMDVDVEGYCSPVRAEINGSKGSKFIYTWDFGDGNKLQGDSSFVYHTFYNSGYSDTSFTVSLQIETQHGCVDSIEKVIPVYPNPIADFFVTPETQDYPESTVEILNYSGEGNWQYLWQFGDGNSSIVKEPGNHTYGTYGDFIISLKTYSEYCADSTSRKIHILPPPPSSSFSPDTSGCGPLTVQFRNESLYGETFLWDFDDGTYSTKKDPVHTFLDKRQYSVSLTVNGQSGISKSSKLIVVHPDPVASFRAYPQEATRTDQVFRFLNSSEGAVRYEWDFGDGNGSFQPDASHVYNQEGEFDVCLYTWNEYNCPDTIMEKNFIKVIEGEGTLVFANVFRWNRSGPTGGYWLDGEIDNTVFHPHFQNVMNYNLVIYSRWGEKLYESNDLHKGWDGYFNNGELAPQGVYVYKAWVEYVDGRSEMKVGDVTFLH